MPSCFTGRVGWARCHSVRLPHRDASPRGHIVLLVEFVEQDAILFYWYDLLDKVKLSDAALIGMLCDAAIIFLWYSLLNKMPSCFTGTVGWTRCHSVRLPHRDALRRGHIVLLVEFVEQDAILFYW